MEGLRSLDFQEDAEEWNQVAGTVASRTRGVEKLDPKVSNNNEWTTSTAVLEV